ncbi:hypothetical protein V8E53_002218 [Lactarius tabidus]
MSFISVEPQSRAILESHNSSLLAQFDTQLEFIADRYLAFFEERRSIEATYVDSLRKLHRKAETVDASFEPRADPTTTRIAWDKVRDNLGREADTQQAFIDILAKDVIGPLEILKKNWDKQRNNIQKDLKHSASMYANLAENRVAKLQQAYSRKYQPQKDAHAANVSQHPQDIPNKRFGSRVSALFRGRREDQREPEPAKAAPTDEVSDDDCREAVSNLNKRRLIRADILGDGYNFLEQLAFTPTIKGVLVKYMDGMIKACAKHNDIAKSTEAEVENALCGTDTSDLRESLNRALSFSIPPLTLYRNCRPGGYSNLIFGVPLLGHGISDDKVPKVMRMCIEEVEKRGLNMDKIYSSSSIRDTEVRKLLRRFESEKSFLFTSTDNIHSVAALLKRYLYDLPEPLFVLPWKEYRRYTQERDEYAKNNFSLLRSKILEQDPVHRASLEALLRHLLHVASHSDKNGMTVKTLSSQFCQYILGTDPVFQGIHVKAPVLEDLIQNAHTLFDERSSQTPVVPSSYVAETESTLTHGSLFLSPEMPESVDVQATGSSSRHRPEIVDGASTRSSFSSFPSDASPESRLTPPPIDLLSPLLGLSSSKTLTEGVETTTQEGLFPEARSTEAIALPNSTPADVVPLPAPTSVAEWRLHQSQLPPDPEALRIPQSPPESVLSSTSDFPLSSATSLQTRLWSP